MLFVFLFFFFFSSRRRHTRYIGDWSSDVCSSDLVPKKDGNHWISHLALARISSNSGDFPTARSEERRVGKECRWRGSAEQRKKRGRGREGSRGVRRRETGVSGVRCRHTQLHRRED